MATEIKSKDSINYYNKVDIEIIVKDNISGNDMKTIQDAINTIIDTAKKYYVEDKKEDEE